MSQEESVVNKILKSYQNVDMIFGTHNIHKLPEILEEAYLSKAMVVEVWSKEATSLKIFLKYVKAVQKHGLTLCMAVINSVHIALYPLLGVKNVVVDQKILLKKFAV